MKILTVCPSIRKNEAVEMFMSFKETTYCSDIIFINRKGSITKLMNEVFENNPEYDFYHITNDDTYYKTYEWDKILAEKIIEKGGSGISYGNDLLGGENLPTFPFISGDIVRAVGWLQLPCLSHLCGDMVWKMLGIGLNKLFYVPQVVIEHRHYLNKKSQKDKVYESTNSMKMYEDDNKVFRDWVNSQFKFDLMNIKGVLDGKT